MTCVYRWLRATGLVGPKEVLSLWARSVVEACDGRPAVYRPVLERALREPDWMLALESAYMIDGVRALRPMVEDGEARKERLAGEGTVRRERDAQREVVALQRMRKSLERHIDRLDIQIREEGDDNEV